MEREVEKETGKRMIKRDGETEISGKIKRM